MSFILELLEAISTVGGIMPKYKAYRGKSRSKPVTFYTSLKRLDERGLIKKHGSGAGLRYVITAKGLELLKHKPSLNVKRSDGFSSLVCFDIPEEKRKARNALRRFLLRSGFTMVQKSIFVSPDKIHKQLLNLVKELDIKSNVKIISGRFDYL